ncbi:uncharacterized protein N0V89_011095 [Didymosphaeria variabile]|uniref:Sugar phosphate transporter domain-containing protein n=1 Tax=Didymosphaeria variabile TaxID=1932322 RepID=A0A9W8XDE8_9PLEO|nr:uncharacterized protein N0V89_011095 [Didymosphaeria variabile]KAJ4347157.1 hypothetical protein N0V89_011095 [Didymosphaeria variabile]
MSTAEVVRWLEGSKAPARPDSLLHPADVFPLATISNPPSSTDPDADSDDGARHAPRNIASLVHPPTPKIMEDQATANHARRRSSSLAGASAPSQHADRKHRRRKSESDNILEEGEDRGSDSDSSGRTDSDDLELDDMSADGLQDDEETGLTGRDRRRRRRRKRRNTLLENRVVPEEPKFTKEEEKIANQTMIQSMLINALLIGLWYLFSISISVYNKWMFKEEKEDGETKNIFPFPLFTTCLHMVVQFTLASLVLFMIPSLRPRHDSLDPHAPGAREELVDPKKPLMTKWFYFTRIGPCGVATGMDIGLGNTSLKFITLTFFKQISYRLIIIITIMTLGVIMMVAGETDFDVRGFILVMSSACSSGFRWSLTQILLLRNPATANPFSSIFFLAPVMFLSILVLAIPVEGFPALFVGLSRLFEMKGTLLGIGILLFPGCLAFLMTASEFALLKRTSVVTLSICGIFKEVVTITTANFVFHDPLTPINLTGLVVTICSIAAYNYFKVQKMRNEARINAHLAAQDLYAPVNTQDPDPVRPRISTSGGLVRNSLSLNLGAGASAERAATDSPSRASPVKRPEDLE